ncbi:bifunctional riboflavin kinase/FAD synthetase [Orbaceae bacterium ac157xtp]
MKVIRGLINLPQNFQQCVLTLGNFDGIHLGHQALIERIKEIGKAKGLPTVVLIFEPQPTEFFKQLEAPARLSSFYEKYTFIKSLGVDYLVAIPFNHSFSQLSAQLFIEQCLISKLKAQYIVIGDDFRFGAGREGGAELLNHYANFNKFSVQAMSTYAINGERVSSTSVRKALANNDFQHTKKLLGRPYSIQGKVIHGNQLARKLGFPTANIHLNRLKPALHGVYFVKVDNVCNNEVHYGIANIGIRPTINGKVAILEVNIFDFNQDIYGQYLQVEFIKKIRDEVKFDSLADLQLQIAQDICIAEQIKAKFYY